MKYLFINGKIYTQSVDRSIEEAVLVEDGLIQKLGTSKDLLDQSSSGAIIIDLEGKIMVPGFNDSHIHLLNYAYGLSKLDLGGAKNIPELIARGKKVIQNRKSGEDGWLSGRGLDQNILEENRIPNRWDLDQISTEVPIVFTRVCEHIVTVNSKALELCGINASTSQPEGGHIDQDEEGTPTGVLREAARYLVYERIPPANKAAIKSMLAEAAEVLSSYGLTSLQTDDIETFSDKDYEVIFEAYRELIDEGKLPLRIYKQCLLPSIERLQAFLDKGYNTGVGDGFFKIGPLKLLTDGTLGARTAYLNEPYADEPDNRGINVFTQDQLDELVMTAHQNDMQVLTHAIGDGAMDMCMDAMEKAQLAYPKDDPRFGIVHLQLTSQRNLERFKEQNIIAFAEPICINSDLYIVEDRIGAQRAKTAYNFRSLIDAGVHLTLSTDTPVDLFNPMKSIYVAVNRKDYNGHPEAGWRMDEALTVEQAVYAYTAESAYASFEEDVKGSIEPGKYADLVVLSEDIYQIDPNRIQDVAVEMTIMNGNIVYERSEVVN